MLKARKSVNISLSFLWGHIMLDLPQFSAIQTTTVVSELDALLEQARQTIAELEQLEQVTWQNFALPMQAADQAIDDYFAPVSHLNAVKNNAELREAYQQCVEKLTEFSSELGQNKAIFQQYNKLAESDEFAHYSDAQKKWVEYALRNFRLAGVDLPEEKQQRFKEIRARLAQLSQDFSNHVLDATQAWTKLITDKAQLAGLPDSVVAMLAQKAKEKEQEGYLLTLDFPVYYAVMSYAKLRPLRQEVYLAYMTKASEQGPQAGQFDNSAIMVETLQLRHELAKLLGFANYAERSLATKMADTVEQVCDFLLDLADKSMPYAEKELAELKQFAKRLGIDELQAWDVTYVSEAYRQENFKLSQEVLREYFPLPKVMQGLFTICEKLFDIQIQAIDSFDSYHEDVQLYGVYRQQELIAGFYLDPFARDNKRGGAWMADARSRWLNADGKEETPIAFLTCNFRPAAAGEPALLSHDEVTTLFHEFGHGLHHMLTRVNVAGISGIAGVEWDAVELPSQFLENWCWQKEALAFISEHYQSQEALPEELLASMLAAKNFNAGMMMLRQIEFALFDMLLHSMSHIDKAEQIQEVLEQVRDRVAVVFPPEEVRFQHGFSHIFAGGYAAGYFSYKWAEVLSADAFAAFEENGIFDAATGQRFLDEILARGSSRSAAENFAAFRGRAATIDALLTHSGLV